MMPYALELEQDQSRIEAQDAIAQIYDATFAERVLSPQSSRRIAGESDGYEGTYPQQDNYEYLSGYVMGVWRYRAQEISKQTGEDFAPF